MRVQLLPNKTLLEVFKCCAGTDMPAVEYVSRRWNGITRTHAHHLPVPANPFAQKLNVKKHSQWPGCLCFSLSTLLYFCLFTFFIVHVEVLNQQQESPSVTPTVILAYHFMSMLSHGFKQVYEQLGRRRIHNFEKQFGALSAFFGCIGILFGVTARFWYYALSDIASKKDGDGTNWLLLFRLLITSVLLVPLAVAVLAIMFIAFAGLVLALQLLRLHLQELRFYGLFRASDRARYTFLRMVCSPLTMVCMLLSFAFCISTNGILALLGVAGAYFLLYIAISLLSFRIIQNTPYAYMYYPFFASNFKEHALLSFICCSFDLFHNVYDSAYDQ